MSEMKITIQPEQFMPKMQQVWELVHKGLNAGAVVVTLGREKRSKSQNARLWATLTDVAQQVEWHGQYLSQEDWKNIFTASLTQQRVVPAIDGGFVVLGTSTSKMNKQQFGDLLELINAFGANHNVQWSDPALEAFEHYREAQA
jgi:hypothetical protein